MEEDEGLLEIGLVFEEDEHMLVEERGPEGVEYDDYRGVMQHTSTVEVMGHTNVVEHMRVIPTTTWKCTPDRTQTIGVAVLLLTPRNSSKRFPLCCRLRAVFVVHQGRIRQVPRLWCHATVQRWALQCLIPTAAPMRPSRHQTALPVLLPSLEKCNA